jgi:hypothetical protein
MARSEEDKHYFQKQQSIAGCMVHGPHGMFPVPLPYPVSYSGSSGTMKESNPSQHLMPSQSSLTMRSEMPGTDGEVRTNFWNHGSMMTQEGFKNSNSKYTSHASRE